LYIRVHFSRGRGVISLVEYIPNASLCDVTATKCHGCRIGVWGRPTHFRAHQSLGPSRRLPHPQHRL